MKNPEIMDANGVAESLSIMFHKDNCSVIAIQDAVEESVTGADLVSKLNSLRLFSRFQLDRETPEYARLIRLTAGARHIIFGNHHYNNSRYHMLNLHASFTKGTIEFRLFQFDEPHDGKKGEIHCGQLKAYIQLCLTMSQLAKDIQHASPIPQ